MSTSKRIKPIPQLHNAMGTRALFRRHVAYCVTLHISHLAIFDLSKRRLTAAMRSKRTAKAGQSRSWILGNDASYQLSPLDGIKKGPLMVTYLLDTVHHLLSDAFGAIGKLVATVCYCSPL
ncbi:CcmH [Trichinella spiralis]|uniref:CcmH n=1 Tax=Trichinella spiralis TaxID=6334 RepID=UPI0001EFB1EF|nr:CcmH [Trichinella spiralis]